MVILSTIVMFLILVGLASIHPNRSNLTEFELRRRLDAKEEGALLQWRRGEYRTEVMTLRRIVIAYALVITSTALIVQYGWGWGLFAAFIITLIYNRASSFPPIRSIAQRLYNRYEENFLKLVEQYQWAIRPFRGIADAQIERRISSRPELEHVFEGMPELLSREERQTLSAMLYFEEKKVRDYMTPRSVMEAIGAKELLGPLVLDSLHRTGHTHFPVFEGDIDHLVGILHIYSLFTLDNKKSLMVKDAMEPRVFYIHEDQSLADALSACIKHRRHLLVVINEYRETVGVITIEDAVEQLIGRKIVDQFAEHDDLRKVAARNPRKLNASPKSIDV